MTKSRIARRCSMRPSAQPADDASDVDSRRPVQLVAQGREVAPAARMQEAGTVRRAAHVDPVAVDQAGERLHVEVHAGVAAGDDLDRHGAGVGHDDRPVREVVRRDRHHHPAGDARMQDRPAGRERVRGRAGRRADDQAVGAQVGDEIAVDLDLQLDHAGGGAAADDHVVEGEALEDAGAVALDVALEHRPLLFVVLALEDGGERRLVAAEGDVGDEAEPALVDADERRAVAGELAGDAEHRAVAAEDDRDVAGGAEGLGIERGPGVDAGVARRLGLDRDRQAARDQEFRDRAELFADAAGVEFADERSVPEAGRHSRDYTTATPFLRRRKWACYPRERCWTSAPRPC